MSYQTAKWHTLDTRSEIAEIFISYLQNANTPPSIAY